jgi:plastocyanin
MKPFSSIQFSAVFRRMLVLAVLIVAQPVQAEEWQALASAQSEDKGKQFGAFLPNELWVHVGDSITWAFAADEEHTVTFLKQNTIPQQIRPPRPGVPGGGCPGTTPDGSSFDGSTCVTSGELVDGQTYTVNFPTAGNFKLVCLLHIAMTGAVHVLDLSETLPHDRAFYDRQANEELANLLSDASRLERRGIAMARRTSRQEVSAGIGDFVETGAGRHLLSVMRFLPETIVVHVGDTVEWTLESPTSHTVTFGTEPADLRLPSAGVTVDSDGARHAVIASPTEDVNSGLLGPKGQDRGGLAQLPLEVTRFRVTFTQPGIFNYFCAQHDELDMVGKVIVHR